MRPIEVSWSSSAVRSCITRCARLVSFQRFGSSAWVFNSSRRLRALSTSKMPPQQPNRLLDFIDNGLDFGAHDGTRKRNRGGNLMSAQAENKALRERLIGTWRLIAAEREDLPSRKKTAFLGDNPTGFLHYMPEGRMLALITRAGRKKPAALVANAVEAEALIR